MGPIGQRAQEGSDDNPFTKPKPESGSKLSPISKAVFTITSEVRSFSTISEKTHKVNSEKLNDLLDRISKIRKDLVEEEQKDLLLQLTHAENTLNRIKCLDKKTSVTVVIPCDGSDKEISFDADLVRHLKTLEDLRNDVGSGPIPLPEMITPEIFNGIIQLLTILPSDLLEKPEDRSDLLDIALSKMPKDVSFSINKDNWILILNAANFLDCRAVMRLCTDFAERHINLGDFKPEESKKPEWADFVKRMPEKFLNKMAHQFLDNPTVYSDLLSLFGPAIKKLDLSTGGISQENLNKLLINCPALEELILRGSTLITEIPVGFTQLKKLSVQCSCTQEGLNNLATRYPALEELDLYGSTLITEIPVGFTQLKKLDLRSTGFTQEALNKLATRYPALEELNLYECKMITEIPEGFSRLKKLNASETSFTQEALNKLATRCPALEELILKFCENVTEIPAGFTQLKKLSVLGIGFTQEALNKLATRCPALEKLNISYNKGITEIPVGFTQLKKLNATFTGFTQEALNKLATRCPALEELNLYGCKVITEIPEGFSRLKKLNVSKTSFTQEELNSLPARYPALEELVLGKMTAITEIPVGFTCLKKLDVGCTCFTQKALNLLVERYPALEELSIGWNDGITQIPEGFSRLKKLISFSTELTQEALNNLLVTCPALEELTLTWKGRDFRPPFIIPEVFDTRLKICHMNPETFTRAALLGQL